MLKLLSRREKAPLSADAFSPDAMFWMSLREQLLPEISAMFRELFLMGAAVAEGLTPIRTRAKDILPNVNPEAITNALDTIVANYTDTWWSSLTFEQSRTLRRAIDTATERGLGSDYVMEQIERSFAASRIKTIAITETTRLIGLGAQATYAAAGIETWQWQTVRDPRVCPICEPLQGQQFPIALPFAPKHPNCRCFPRPVVLAP